MRAQDRKTLGRLAGALAGAALFASSAVAGATGPAAAVPAPGPTPAPGPAPVSAPGPAPGIGPAGNKNTPPRAPSMTGPSEPDPWAGRTDLFIPPDLKPTTKVTLGALARTKLPNGLAAVIVPRRQIPSVEVTLAVRLPETAEPLDKAGLSQFVAAMLRKGTTRRSADQISDAIDFVGGNLGAAASGDAAYISCHARAKDVGLCMDLVADLGRNPSFPESEMREVRDLMMAQINGAKDDPQTLASWHASNVYFGDDDPRGRPTSRKSIESRVVGREPALVEVDQRWFAPNNALLAVSGDIDEKAARVLIAHAFGSWAKRKVPPIVDPPVRPLPQAAGGLSVRLVDKPDATQSVLMVIGQGIKRADKDFYAVRLMNYALGSGGFSSRLMKVVRSEGGKTYGVSSSFESGREVGLFSANTFTRNGETIPTLKLVLDEIAKMKAGGPTDEELRAAKANLIGGYGLHLETGADLAEELLADDICGLDSRFVSEYPARLEAVTVAEAAKAAATHLDPRALVVVGKATEVGPMLRKAGYKNIEVVSYLDPVSAAERKEVVNERATSSDVGPAEAMEGRRLVDLALKAKGGAAALGKVKALEMTGRGTMKAQGQSVPVEVARHEIIGQAVREDFGFGAMHMSQIYVPGKRAFMRQGDKQMDMPTAQQAEMESAMFRDANFILLHALQPAVRTRGLVPITENGVTYDAFEVEAPNGELTRVLLDPKTHQIARLLYNAEGHQVREEYGDYRILNGVTFAFHVKEDAGEQTVDVSYDKVTVNPTLASSLFE